MIYMPSKHRWQYKLNGEHSYDNVLITTERYPTVSQLIKHLNDQHDYQLHLLNAEEYTKNVWHDPLYRFIDLRVDGESYLTISYGGEV